MGHKLTNHNITIIVFYFFLINKIKILVSRKYHNIYIYKKNYIVKTSATYYEPKFLRSNQI